MHMYVNINININIYIYALLHYFFPLSFWVLVLFCFFCFLERFKTQEACTLAPCFVHLAVSFVRLAVSFVRLSLC